jgi:hypothetical protein
MASKNMMNRYREPASQCSINPLLILVIGAGAAV